MPLKAPIAALVAIGGLQLAFLALFGANSAESAFQRLAAGLGLPYNTMIVLLGTGMLGMGSGVIGSFAVLRGRSLIGDAVAHAALPGIVIAFIIVRQRDFVYLLAGALIAGILGAALISWLRTNTRIKADAATGLILSVFFGIGIALAGVVQHDPSGQQAGLDTFLLGKTAGLVTQDLLLISLVAANIILIVALFYKEFLILSFDPGFGIVQRFPILLLDLLLMALLVVATVIGLPAVGVVLMAAMLIIPGVAARFWTDRLSQMLLIAGGIGLVTGIAGTWLSSRAADLPTGPVIVLTGTVICLASMLVAPRRGVIARLLDHLRLQRKVARQNLLRTLYEISEPALPERTPFNLEDLLERRAWSKRQARSLVAAAEARGEVAGSSTGEKELTDKGLKAAAAVVRTHRMWEAFLVQQADIAADHVDRDADELEHVLTPEMVVQLEETLRETGRLPEPLPVPESVHPIGSTG